MASTYGFIGLGLIGGSIAKGLKAAEPDCVIMAYMRSRARLETARSEGTVDRILTGITEELSACDIIFLCTPTELCSEYLAALNRLARKSMNTPVETQKQRAAGRCRYLLAARVLFVFVEVRPRSCSHRCCKWRACSESP